MTTQREIATAAHRMREWAKLHPECDTQGVIAEEWWGLARAALDDSGWDEVED